MNKVLLQGRLTAKPELTIAKSGMAYTKITLAIDDYKAKETDEKTNVDFIDVKAFGKAAEILTKFTDKGQILFVEAKAKQNIYEKEDGAKVYSIDFILNEFEFVGGQKKQEEAQTATNEETKENLPS